jgi:hypothetical protein
MVGSSFSPIPFVGGFSRSSASDLALTAATFPRFDPVLATVRTQPAGRLNRNRLGKGVVIESSGFPKYFTLSERFPLRFLPLLHRQNGFLEVRTAAVQGQQAGESSISPAKVAPGFQVDVGAFAKAPFAEVGAILG